MDLNLGPAIANAQHLTRATANLRLGGQPSVSLTDPICYAATAVVTMLERGGLAALGKGGNPVSATTFTKTCFGGVMIHHVGTSQIGVGQGPRLFPQRGGHLFCHIGRRFQ